MRGSYRTILFWTILCLFLLPSLILIIIYIRKKGTVLPSHLWPVDSPATGSELDKCLHPKKSDQQKTNISIPTVSSQDELLSIDDLDHAISLQSKSSQQYCNNTQSKVVCNQNKLTSNEAMNIHFIQNPDKKNTVYFQSNSSDLFCGNDSNHIKCNKPYPEMGLYDEYILEPQQNTKWGKDVTSG